MRFIHTADLHIDSPLRGLSRYEGAPLERLRGAPRRALERLVDLAIDEQIDFLLIAGDLYDRDWQDFHTGLFVREQMVRLGRAGIPVSSCRATMMPGASSPGRFPGRTT